MGYTASILEDVRSQLAPSDPYLNEARARRGSVLEAAMSFEGVGRAYSTGSVLRAYASGSIAHGTANKGADADGGVVLNGEAFPSLGPDRGGGGPDRIVEAVREHIGPLIREDYPGARCELQKRSIKVTYPGLVDGEDLSVDLIVALDRLHAPGLWIPNLKQHKWDPSHPERHTELFTSGPLGLRRVRARVTRLGKGWNAQWSEGNRALSSFNIESLVRECIESPTNVAEGLETLFDYAAQELAKADTDDPARVSGPIKLLLPRDVVVQRLEDAAALMHTALDNDDDVQIVRDALAELFRDYVSPADGSGGKAALARALRSGNEGVRVNPKTGLGIGVSGVALKTTNAFGDERT